MNQDLVVVVGQSYELTYRTYFDKCDESEGFVGLMVNHQPVQTTDACDFGAGAFKSNSYDFTATVNPTNLRFEFLVGDTDAVVKIDNGMSIFSGGPFSFPLLLDHSARCQTGSGGKEYSSAPSDCPLFPDDLSRRREC